MITLIQRVKSADVTVDKDIIGKINQGLLLYTGYEENDSEEKNEWTVNKIINLRIFQDENEKMNRSLLDVNSSVLLISNFTLPADLAESGRRPSFTKSAKPEIAEKLYDNLIQHFKSKKIQIETGKFGAMMYINSVADGPVNFILRI